MKRKINIGLIRDTGLSPMKQMEKLCEAGFDGIFFDFGRGEKFIQTMSAAKELKANVVSLHSPYLRCDKLWYPNESTEDVISEQLECIRACHENGIAVSVHHVFIGFELHEPTEAGLYSFDRVVNEAERLGVKLAFENTEGIEYFDAVMDRYKNTSAVGFCIDTGHELCYNPGRDLVSQYGDRLSFTHVNDNLGVCGNKITYLDDLHLLPFDGKVDFENFAKRLGKVHYNGDLSFELSRTSKPNRHENDGYAEMSFDDYLREAYSRADKVVKLCEKYASR